MYIQAEKKLVRDTNNDNYIHETKKCIIYMHIFITHQVTYKADSLQLDFLKLAQNGNQLISVIGEPEWKCRDIGPGSPLAFKSGPSVGDNHMVCKL